MAPRFSVTYFVRASDEEEARQRALDIALEQTVEIPRSCVPKGYVEDEILGRLETLEKDPSGRPGYLADISYSEDDVGGDFLQFLNIVFGNSSIKPGLKVEDIALSPGILALSKGPRHGIAGLRARAGIGQTPLLMSAIKPVGLPTSELARLAHDFALGGMHFVKDDHGLVDQKTSPFEERLRACVEAVGEANAKTDGRTSFVPNVTGPATMIVERAMLAQETGAGAVMIAPALAGYDIIRILAAEPDFSLPIISHPAFSGANVVSPDCGFSHRSFFGTLHRLMGADAVIYPNFGGRFGFTRDECLSIAKACADEIGGPKAIVAAPGGGMTFSRVPEMREAYGSDVMYLIGGALLQEENLVDACRRLVSAVYS
ncbi:RuBisCO large subunit C-terminal-like domain-containing protein [Agrobacterium sp. RAC06]|uniref:RuBisCO large subunit C-terminal-like domain-containing protein n=1 Tax=Agrobacterium sp. RAC06 TaxID=1842536 RepID=UPI00083CCAB2|nr:RuBisCO large subunit C-terminal-like domain-containing protein [Agrobacterium sp. RAC06]AOG11958.1 ribulose bisphosphate carboxylase large chain, catalytic domain protein [Agrobacterium sp. RAC06]